MQAETMVQVKELHQVHEQLKKEIRILQGLLTKGLRVKLMTKPHQGQVSLTAVVKLLMKNLQVNHLQTEMQELRKDIVIKMFTNTGHPAVQKRNRVITNNPGNMLLLNQGKADQVKNILHPDLPIQGVYKTNQASSISGIYLKAGIRNQVILIRKDMLHQRVLQGRIIRNHPGRITDTLHLQDHQVEAVIHLRDQVAARVTLHLPDRVAARVTLLHQDPVRRVPEPAEALPAGALPAGALLTAREVEDNS